MVQRAGSINFRILKVYILSALRQYTGSMYLSVHNTVLLSKARDTPKEKHT